MSSVSQKKLSSIGPCKPISVYSVMWWSDSFKSTFVSAQPKNHYNPFQICLGCSQKNLSSIGPCKQSSVWGHPAPNGVLDDRRGWPWPPWLFLPCLLALFARSDWAQNFFGTPQTYLQGLRMIFRLGAHKSTFDWIRPPYQWVEIKFKTLSTL